MRLQRLVSSVRAHFSCGAVALLQLEEDHLRPVAVDGLTQDALGRRFAVQQHPRLAAILARRGVTCFHHDSTLPDPYDGLINGMAGEPLPVHDCMGTSLHVEGQPWGVLTLDALEVGTFGAEAQSELRELIMLVEAALRTTRLEAETRALRLTRGQSGPTARPPTTTRSWARASPSPACCTRSTWCRTRNCPSCCWERPAWARNCSRTACTGCRDAAPSRWCT